jgi:hypothetical protein
MEKNNINSNMTPNALYYGIHATQNEVIILKRIIFLLKISTCFSAATHKGSAYFHQAGSSQLSYCKYVVFIDRFAKILYFLILFIMLFD